MAKETIELYGGAWDGTFVDEKEFSQEGRVELAGHTLTSFTEPIFLTVGSKTTLLTHFVFLKDPMIAIKTHVMDSQSYHIWTHNRARWDGPGEEGMETA